MSSTHEESSTSFITGMRDAGNGLLVRVSVLAAVGGLLFGYDTGVISGALLFIKKDLHANTFEQQAIVSVLLLGAMAGAVASGYLADRVSTVANWGANFLVAATFLSLTGAITSQGTFILYAVLATVAFLFFAAKVPETKNRSLEEIQEEVTADDR